MFGDKECELWGDLIRIPALPHTSCDVLGTYLASLGFIVSIYKMEIVIVIVAKTC